MVDVIDFNQHKAKLDTEAEVFDIVDAFEMMADQEVDKFVDDLAFMLLIGEPANDHEEAKIAIGEDFELYMSDIEEIFRDME